ncbi:hypothetical protein ACIQVT_13375 [Streptomyces sp. NPDC100445]|uniref:hypothetical protein n=1 Tax=Streptomyces sp. NPDC100445 TaxID=3366102 RepID=UPI0038110556
MTTATARRPRFALRWKTSRDWPLAAAAVFALLSFAMLFLPWLTTSAGSGENAFGIDLPTAGPALIVAMVFLTLLLLVLAAGTGGRRYLEAALVPASVLLAAYILKAADVSDLADLYSRLAASFTGATIGTGVGLWLGLAFAVLTLLFVLAGVLLHWGTGDALTYPAFGAGRRSRPGAPPAGDTTRQSAHAEAAPQSPHPDAATQPPHPGTTAQSSHPDAASEPSRPDTAPRPPHPENPPGAAPEPRDRGE